MTAKNEHGGPKNPFTLLRTDPATRARRGRLTLPHGVVETPAFMPVGTVGALKALTPRDARDCGAQMILANTYHLTIRPGEELVRKLGGLHKFMGWDGPILTDSGGYQVFSLPGKEITEEGVRFRFEVSGERIVLTPEKSMEIQQALGPDVAMAFDECIPFPCEEPYAAASIERTLRWAKRCLKAHVREDQHLFGIVQGGLFPKLRERCAKAIAEMPFNGIAVGGVSVGEGHENLKTAVDLTERHLPADKVRYLMGVGLPQDILESVERGMDIFDCVIPTRYARGGTLFTVRGKIRIEHNNYRRDAYPIDTSCDCYACANFSRAYLRHLFLEKEFLGTMLASIHNVRFYQRMMAGARAAIEAGNFAAWKTEFLTNYGFSADENVNTREESGDAAPPRGADAHHAPTRDHHRRGPPPHRPHGHGGAKGVRKGRRN
ncbi:MAG: tRNA guanosine(34) transglycosylase Tgt [Planctomycetes bacterium]|nr:tRNA guanosine(34) transglycosylase Tgt [Planctomycetota bacterium]